MKGSEKQIKWAAEILATAVATATERAAKHEARAAKGKPAFAAKAATLRAGIERAATIEDAALVIDVRANLAGEGACDVIERLGAWQPVGAENVSLGDRFLLAYKMGHKSVFGPN